MGMAAIPAGVPPDAGRLAARLELDQGELAETVRRLKSAVSHHLAVKGQALHRIAVVCVYVTVSPIWQLCSWV